VVLCTLAFAAIGIAVSAAARSQVIAAAASIVILLFLCLLAPGETLSGGAWKNLTAYLSPVEHAREMIRGVVSAPACVYFVSLILLGVLSAMRILSIDRLRASS